MRVIRLPRHGASLPIGLGVSCSADRQALGKITREGVFLEQLEAHPADYLPEVDESTLGGDVVRIDLNQPMSEILGALSQHPIRHPGLALGADDRGARFSPMPRSASGSIVVNRCRIISRTTPVYYAGPAKTPEGYASGSFGPTTAGRMDSFVDQFQAAGGSMVMLAKGNRSPQVRQACQAHGGFYLGSIGGPAARLAQDCIKKVEALEYPELGDGGDLEDRGREISPPSSSSTTRATTSSGSLIWAELAGLSMLAASARLSPAPTLPDFQVGRDFEPYSG